MSSDSKKLLQVRESIPDGLLDCDVADLHNLLEGPTLIHLRGRRPEPLFISVLLHGNEPVGMQAVQALLKRYVAKQLPRALSIFIGNVSAARIGMRRLDGQADYNRVWSEGTGAEHEMTSRIVEIMRERNIFASIDVHNNTGLNPHYACINRLDNQFLRLAMNYSRTVVYFTKPEGVQSKAFATLCPSTTIECGQPGQAHGVEHAAEYLDAVLNMAGLTDRPVNKQDIDIVQTLAIVKVPHSVSFSFDSDDEDVDLCFSKDLDHMNFSELPIGTVIAKVKNGSDVLLHAMDANGEDRASEYFDVQDGKLCTKQTILPSMLTLNEKVIRQDCLCYLMESISVPERL